jgi:hypothetical protein
VERFTWIPKRLVICEAIRLTETMEMSTFRFRDNMFALHGLRK